MKNYFTIILLLFQSILFSQNKVQESSALFDNNNYFHELQQEKFFLHTNKTTYFTSETIWWKAYVVSDFSNKTITNTTNLYVNFYDANMKLISQQLFYCENGIANGEITLPDSLDTGEYFINLDTAWNKNFDNKYIVPIYIINSATTSTSEEDIKVNETDALIITFYPESGSLLNNTTNIVYLTLHNNESFLAEQTVTITDNTTHKTIANFTTNKHGHAKFNVFCQANNTYKATVIYKDKVYTEPLPIALDSGVLIHKKEQSNKLSSQDFTIEFSEDLLNQYHKKTFFATIHRNQKLLYILPFELNKKHKKYVLPIDIKNLFNGFNTITLFNAKNQPLAERHFYVETKQMIDIETIQNKITKDSVILNFQLKNSYKNTNLSISVLPKDTKLITNASNILDAFLLDPYLKSNNHPITDLLDADLDILLQTQSKQTGTHTFNNSPPIYSNAKGLSIKGSINTEVKNAYKVLLTSTENEILEVTEVKQDKSFLFSNLILKDSSDYKLALLDEKGAIVKAGIYVYKQNENYKADSLLIYNNEQFLTAKEKVEAIENTHTDDIIKKNTEILNEVVLQGKKREEFTGEYSYPNRPNLLGNGFTKDLHFDEVDEMNNTVIQFLNNQAGVVASEGIGASVVITRATLDSFYDDTQALIILNGIPTDAESIAFLPLSEVESLGVNATGAGYGMRGNNGVVTIELKKGNNTYKRIPNPNYYRSTTDFGFTKSKPIYEASLLQFNSSTSRQFYETLDWIPNFNVLPNKANSLKIYKGEHKQIKLFINGMNSDGELFYKVLDVPIKTDL
ncbi:hypothetical protein [Xanthomarina sp. F2636L]|uniref:hypothetical protein n=1 Tax=Xanthomarina sp. F2636L TaxID=2996018 RepID=UPI00225E2EB3|nr:hypothetical protein [Xanthomarina sp. F2636L]MCX7549901.1 hypothetical protein [Xanthomarina sp. F2636L]